MKYFLSIVCLLNSICYGQIYFNTTFDIGGMPEVYASVLYNPIDSSFTVHGNAAGDQRPYLMKIDYYGDVIFPLIIENDYSGFFYSAGLASSLVLDYGGNSVFAGFVSNGSGSSNGYVVKLNTDGDTLWTKEIGVLGNADPIRTLAMANDSNYVIAGATQTFSPYPSDQNFWLVKLDTNGNMLWQNNYGGGGVDYALNVDTTIDGGYIIGGYTQSYGSGESDIYIVKTDAVGNFEWHKWFGQSSYDSGFIKSLADGHFIVYGAFKYENPENLSQNAPHAVVMELDENGNQLWFKEYSEYPTTSPLYYTHDEGFNSMVLLSDGYLFSGGTDDSLDDTRLGWAVKTDFDGNQIWTRTFRKRNSANYFHDVLALPNGDLVFTGFVWPEGSFSQDGWIVRTNCLGFDGPPEASANWQSDDNYTVVIENSSQRYGDGVINWGDGNSTIFTEFDDTLLYHTYATSGAYTVELIVNACNEADTIYLNVSATMLGLQENDFIPFKLFPNPAVNELNMSFQFEAEDEIFIYDIQGKVVLSKKAEKKCDNIALETSFLESGVYFVFLTTKNSNYSERLIISR